MAEVALKLDQVTVEEFLRFQGELDARYELVHGEIVAMAPPARRHRVIAVNAGTALHARLKPPCLAESEAGILLPWSAGNYYVADLAVSCSAVGDERWCPEPVLIVEVLSPSTEDDDRKVKLPSYRRLPSVTNILLVASTSMSVEHYVRSGPFWRLYDLGPDDAIVIEELSIEIPVAELYAGLSFASPDDKLQGRA